MLIAPVASLARLRLAEKHLVSLFNCFIGARCRTFVEEHSHHDVKILPAAVVRPTLGADAVILLAPGSTVFFAVQLHFPPEGNALQQSLPRTFADRLSN